MYIQCSDMYIHVWNICYLFVNVYTCEEPVIYMYRHFIQCTD